MIYEIPVVLGREIRAFYEGRESVILQMETVDGDLLTITSEDIEIDRYYEIERDRTSVKLTPVYHYDSFEDYLNNN